MPNRTSRTFALLLAAVLSASASAAAQPGGVGSTSRWRLEVTPFAGRGQVSALVDQTTTMAEPMPGDDTLYLAQRRSLTFGPASMLGARLTLRFGGPWSAWVEGVQGGAQLHFLDRVEWRQGPGFASSGLARRDDASIASVALGASRAMRLPFVEADAGAAVTLTRLALDRVRIPCTAVSCFWRTQDAWSRRYLLPGVGGALALRVPLTARVGVEARGALAIGRASTSGFEAGARTEVGTDSIPASRWVRTSTLSLGVTTRLADVMGTEPASDAMSSGRRRVMVTSIAGVAVSSPLLDRRSVATRSEVGVSTTYRAHRQLALGDAAVVGARVALGRVGWVPFVEAAAGRAAFTSTDSITARTNDQPMRAGETIVQPRDPAFVATLALGATRALALGRALALDVGGGAVVQRFGLERRAHACDTPYDIGGGSSGEPSCPRDPWEETYWAPGAAGVAGVRWSVAPRLALEARTTLTLTRSSSGSVAHSELETLAGGDVEPGPTWVRGARLALGLSFTR